MPNYWIDAVKQWNKDASHDGYLIPKTGTEYHKRVRSIMEGMKKAAEKESAAETVVSSDEDIAEEA
jgi:hypothetical protein